MAEPFALLDATPAPRPAHSRLYALVPAGVGTPRVESLTSYITRLAAAHCWATRTLVEREIGPRLGWTSSLSTLLVGGGQYLNGAGRAAAKGVGALEELTGQGGLSALTLRPWQDLFAGRGLVRPWRAWCPDCYAEADAHGGTIYEPLVWAVSAVSACAAHRRRLCTRCPRCAADRHPLLTSWLQPGHCSRCGAWLGAAGPATSAGADELWSATVVGELCATTGGEPVPRERLVAAVARCIDQTTQGNIAAFAALIGRPKNTVWLWRQGQVVPSLPLVLQMCRRLGLTLRQFLEAVDPVVWPDVPSSAGGGEETVRPRRTPVPVDRAGVRRLLQDIVQDPERTPSMRAVARTLGYDRGVLYRQAPELCRQIAARHRETAARHGAQRVRSLCAGVQEAVSGLRSDGIEPTRRRVEAQLRAPGILRDEAVRRALLAALAGDKRDVENVSWRDGRPPKSHHDRY
jgi:hypothetical protein